ncbi:glycosyltransferase [Cytophaga sp. FL35]|uniref:glycosyltransferase n=1 Tax=Cytophaga sp. FL35 TaxID=1904456 RepID=UPI001653A9DF|nr:glycosyltransferase [Cytophaga sp. FL35]MBC6996962.1 glycosyltransferase [Cytophaga sp. FL35]
MKLAIVTAYPPSEADLAFYGLQLVKHFRNHPKVEEILVITDRSANKKIELSPEGSPVTIEKCWSFNGWSNFIKVTQHVLKFKPDAVFFNLGSITFGNKQIPAALGFMIPLFSRITGVASISLVHSLPQPFKDYKGYVPSLVRTKNKEYGRNLTKMILASDIVATNTNKMTKLLIEDLKAKNVTKMPYGSFETPQEPDYRISGNKKQILVFGTFGTQKKLEVFLEAIQRIRSKNNELNLEVVIAGKDSKNVPGYMRRIEENHKYMKQLTFMHETDVAQIPKLIEESALVVLPYSQDTEKLKDIHMTATKGKAVVLPYFDGLNEALEERNYRAEVYTPDSPESLSEAIENVLAYNSYRIHLGMANFKAAIANPIEEVIEQYIEYFEAIKRAKMENTKVLFPIPEEINDN